MYDPPGSTGAFDGDVLEDAQSLLEKSAGQSPWGWKDPRSALFLEQWLRLAPDAKFVFVYRQPTQVIHSLRRPRRCRIWQYPGAASVASLGGIRFRIAKAAACIQYNRRIVEFPPESTRAIHHSSAGQLVCLRAAGLGALPELGISVAGRRGRQVNRAN